MERGTCQPCPSPNPPQCGCPAGSCPPRRPPPGTGDTGSPSAEKGDALGCCHNTWTPPPHTHAPQILTLHPQNSPLVGIWEYPGVPALYRSPCRHIAAQEHQRILPWVPSVRAGRLGFSPQPHVLGQDGHIPPSSCIPPPAWLPPGPGPRR